MTVLGARAKARRYDADFFFRRLAALRKLVSRALQVLSKTLDRVQAEDLDQRLPLLGLRLVDEVRERASAKEERLAPERVEHAPACRSSGNTTFPPSVPLVTTSTEVTPSPSPPT